MGTRKAREIWTRIEFRMDLLERGLNAGLLGDVVAERSLREVQAAKYGEEEEDCLAHSFHSTFLYGNMRQAVCWETNREGGRVFSWGVPAQRPGYRWWMSSGRYTLRYVYPCGKTHITGFEEYEEVPEWFLLIYKRIM